jgi:hypothetical protein
MQSFEFELEDGVEFNSYFAEEQAKVFTYSMPPTIPDDAHITIIAYPEKGTHMDFLMSVISDEYDEDASPSSGYSSRRGVPAWKRGQVMRLSKETYPEGWCGGCTLKILVDVYDAGYYAIIVKSTNTDPLVYNENQVDDVVNYGVRQCYRFYTKGENTDL